MLTVISAGCMMLSWLWHNGPNFSWYDILVDMYLIYFSFFFYNNEIFLLLKYQYSKHETMIRYWLNAGPPSATLALTLSSLNLPLSSSSTTSRELLSQFSTCSEWRWLIVGGKWKNVLLLFKKFNKKCSSKTPRCKKLSHFSEIKNDALMHREGWKGF